MQMPSIGRIVHFIPLSTEEGERIAAIVTGVVSGTKVNLKLFYDTHGSPMWIGNVPHRDNLNPEMRAGGHYWEWPPRVEGDVQFHPRTGAF